MAAQITAYSGNRGHRLGKNPGVEGLFFALVGAVLVIWQGISPAIHAQLEAQVNSPRSIAAGRHEMEMPEGSTRHPGLKCNDQTPAGPEQQHGKHDEQHCPICQFLLTAQGRNLLPGCEALVCIDPIVGRVEIPGTAIPRPAAAVHVQARAPPAGLRG